MYRGTNTKQGNAWAALHAQRRNRERAGGGGGPSYIYEDEFLYANGDLGGLGGWTVDAAGRFTVNDGVVDLTGSFGQWKAINAASGEADCTTEFVISAQSVTAGTKFAVFVNSNGSSQWRVWVDGSGQLDLREVPFGSGTLRGSDTVAITVPWTLIITTAGDTITVTSSLGHSITYTVGSRPFQADSQIGMIAFDNSTSIDAVRQAA